MSGALAASAGRSVERTTFTVGAVGGGFHGMSSGSQDVAWRAATSVYADYNSGTQVLRFGLGPSGLGQSYFQRVILEDATPGVFQSFRSSDASYDSLGALWTWTSVASLWTASDIDEVKKIIVEF